VTPELSSIDRRPILNRAIGADGPAQVSPTAIEKAQPLGSTSACEKALRRKG
jgi:hypothetical protein